MNILLAIDGSTFSQSAIEAVMAHSNANGTEVRILHVVEPIPVYADTQGWGFGTEPAGLIEEERAQAEGLVARAAQQLRDAGFKPTTEIEIGNPKMVIVDTAAQWPADLIVLGSHGRKGLEHFLMGSVSEAVARHAPCSVEIVRNKKPR
jgi:nucleotide-binding universal stress UspA family protein